MSYKLKYFNIQSLSLQDGEGIRTTIFLKGCPLRCLWCSNPESQSPKPDAGFGYFESTVESIMERLEKDAVFFRRSGGGVTVSGGEPFLQGEAVLLLLTACRERLWDTAAETCGEVEGSVLQRAASVVDTFYYDIKSINSEEHRKLTGVGNERILSNLKMLYGTGCNIIVRYPLIPGCNNSERDLQLLEEWILRNCPNIQLEFLSYHRLGIPKYEKLGREYKLKQVKSPDCRYMGDITRRFHNAGIVCSFR